VIRLGIARRGIAQWLRALGRAASNGAAPPAPAPEPLKIGLALGGGFARGIAHVGVLRVLERHGIALDAITGVSAGAIVAAAYASGASVEEIGRVGRSMRFTDVARWSVCRMGLMVSERMNRFLTRLLRCYRFEEMQIPLGVIATDLAAGSPVRFHGSGDVILPIRASCSYPGLFAPVPYEGRLLVDGAMSMGVPAALARSLGATRIISVHIPTRGSCGAPRNAFQVVNRCFQILQSRTEESWRNSSDVVIEPEVSGMDWDCFGSAAELIQAGEKAAMAALPQIQAWRETARASGQPSLAAGSVRLITPDSKPA